MSQSTTHWATILKQGDKVFATIRHETDGSKNIRNAEVVILNNNSKREMVMGEHLGQYYTIPYNDLAALSANNGQA